MEFKTVLNEIDIKKDYVKRMTKKKGGKPVANAKKDIEHKVMGKPKSFQNSESFPGGKSKKIGFGSG